MKKLLGVMLALGLTAGGSSNADVAIKKPTALEVGNVLLQSASTILETIPKLIQEIPPFPEKIKTAAQELKTKYADLANKIKAGKISSEDKDKAVEELFVKAINVLVPIQNVLDNFLKLAKLLGPAVGLFNEDAGKKVSESIGLIATTLYVITKVSVGQQRLVKEETGITAPAPEAVEVPNVDL